MQIHLDFTADEPIYRQIRDQIVGGIAGGELAPGERLPSVRALADEAGVNMMTVSKAYQLLRAQEYIVTGRRNGAAVARQLPNSLSARAADDLTRVASEARAAGWSREQFLSLCARLFDGAGNELEDKT